MPSANQCLQRFRTGKLVFVVKMMSFASSCRIKFSDRSVFRRWSARRLSSVAFGVVRCRRMVFISISVLGSWPAAWRGKVHRADWRMALVCWSDVAARALIWLFNSITGTASRFGAWECDVGWGKKTVHRQVSVTTTFETKLRLYQSFVNRFQHTFTASILASKDEFYFCCSF